MRRQKMTTFGLIATLSTFALPATVHADLFTNLGSGFGGPAGVIDSDSLGVFAQAMRFTVPTGAGDILTSVELPLSRAFGTFDELEVAVYSDSANQPGVALDTAIVSGFTTTSSLRTATFSGGVPLLDGLQYWVVAEDMSSGTAQFNWAGSLSATGEDNSFLRTGGWFGPTAINLGFSVNAMPIPAPGAALLGAFGLGMVGWVRRRL